jgi:hypothetical protein
MADRTTILSVAGFSAGADPEPSMRVYRALPVLLLVALSACSMVDMTPAAQDVRVANANENLGVCQRRGEIEVSVKDRLGPYERDALRVRDELEVLARNEAESLAADTLQAKSAPVDGVQRFLAYRCGSAQTAPAARDGAAKESAQTAPLQD